MHPEDPLARSPRGFSVSWLRSCHLNSHCALSHCPATWHGDPGRCLLSPSHPLSLIPRTPPGDSLCRGAQPLLPTAAHCLVQRGRRQKRMGSARWLPCVATHALKELSVQGFTPVLARTCSGAAVPPPPPSSAYVFLRVGLSGCVQDKHVFLFQYVKTKLICPVYAMSSLGAMFPEKVGVLCSLTRSLRSSQVWNPVTYPGEGLRRHEGRA